MVKEYVLERYLNSLLDGNRMECRSIIEEVLQTGTPANRVYVDIIWPIMVEIDRLYRHGQIDSAQEAFASRINRTIVNQLQNKLPRKSGKAKKVVVCSANNEKAELGGQMIADLFESDGWDARFLGGTVSNDDVMTFIHSFKPSMLVIYGIDGKDAPSVRQLIDTIRSVNAFPDMRIMLSGGVFGRAEGLWEEIGADLYAENATEAITLANANPEAIPAPVRTIKQRLRGMENQGELLVETL
ncbi:cobalamin B12-binding domain-containing protein [Anaerohalosphaeraceae bacterium U12dextr]|jgi:methanogenic corrinoid protein MtbC1